MTQPEVCQLVGGLSEPGKLPCYGYSLPADMCITGSKLRTIKGSVCEHCYAHKGWYITAPVYAAMATRLTLFKESPGLWAINMALALESMGLGQTMGQSYFRWHDSGDIQSVTHLAAICWIASTTPEVKHWLPTKEVPMVRRYARLGYTTPILDNLTIRISHPMVGKRLRVYPRGCVTSSVDWAQHHSGNFKCPATRTRKTCDNCRACWDKNITNIDYKQH